MKLFRNYKELISFDESTHEPCISLKSGYITNPLEYIPSDSLAGQNDEDLDALLRFTTSIISGIELSEDIYDMWRISDINGVPFSDEDYLLSDFVSQIENEGIGELIASIGNPDEREIEQYRIKAGFSNNQIFLSICGITHNSCYLSLAIGKYEHSFNFLLDYLSIILGKPSGTIIYENNFNFFLERNRQMNIFDKPYLLNIMIDIEEDEKVWKYYFKDDIRLLSKLGCQEFFDRTEKKTRFFQRF
jgi:hypothetical protein